MENSANKRISKKPPGNRLIIGGVVFVAGFLFPLLIPLVLSSGLSTTFKSVLSGLLAFGIPELFMILAVAIMGKDGFSYLKRYFGLVIRVYGPPDKVSNVRYKIGLVLFIIPLVFGLIAPYFLTNWIFYQENILWITIISDVLFIFSLIVLGGDFWDKLRSLFIHGATAQFPSKTEKK